MDDKTILHEILNNFSSGNASPTERFLVKKLGQDKGLKFIKFLSSCHVSIGAVNAKLSKLTIENDQNSKNKNDDKYLIELTDKNYINLGKLIFKIHTDDPKYIRISFTETHEKEDLEILDTMLKFIDEIAMKIDAKVVDAPYPMKGEQSVYRQHKYEPFSSHATGSDRMYNKYDIKHCKTNILGIFDEENENE